MKLCCWYILGILLCSGRKGTALPSFASLDPLAGQATAEAEAEAAREACSNAAADMQNDAGNLYTSRRTCFAAGVTKQSLDAGSKAWRSAMDANLDEMDCARFADFLSRVWNAHLTLSSSGIINNIFNRSARHEGTTATAAETSETCWPRSSELDTYWNDCCLPLPLPVPPGFQRQSQEEQLKYQAGGGASGEASFAPGGETGGTAVLYQAPGGVPSQPKEFCPKNPQRLQLCCSFEQGTLTYTKIPALEMISVKVRIKLGTDLRLIHVNGRRV